MSEEEFYRAYATFYKPKSVSGMFPRYEEYERSWCLNPAKVEGTFFTTIIPSDSGPKASSKVLNGTVPGVSYKKMYNPW